MKVNKMGFSLVELAIGLAVITVLILTISMSSGIRDNARLQSASQSIQALRSAAENYIASGKLNFIGLDIAALKADNFLSANFNALGSNPWGGDFLVAPNASNTTRFDIALTSVNKPDSAKLNIFFNNITHAISYDESSKTWTATF